MSIQIETYYWLYNINGLWLFHAVFLFELQVFQQHFLETFQIHHHFHVLKNYVNHNQISIYIYIIIIIIIIIIILIFS